MSAQPALTAYRGGLLSGSIKGSAVSGGSFLRQRRIVLDASLLLTPRTLSRIFVHEVFHFAWWKLGRARREAFTALVDNEMKRGAQGELGWSSERLKIMLTGEDRQNNTRIWRDYVCESFCDTAGWVFGTQREYAERTLAKSWRQRRRSWFQLHIGTGPVSI